MARLYTFALLSIALTCLLQWTPVQGLAVMSVDLGSEWMKIAIVSPGVPMDIVLNKESKRKTPAAIAFRNDERTIGEDAYSVGVKHPMNMYFYLLDLLGKTVDNPVVKLYQQRFPHYKIVPDPQRNTVLFQHDSETFFTPEELIAMILSQAKEYAEISAHQQITECVITVPAFFNQAERRAMLKAAELAGLKVLQLINSNTAAALDYGIFRRKDFNETAQHILFYDMGASSTVASVASYQVVKTKERGYTEYHPQIGILGLGYDRTLGGLEIQIRLQHYLANAFNDMKKTKNDVFQSPKAMAKLFKEAGRVKNVLSANTDHYAQVENLLDEQDFRFQVTRDKLEELCKDLFERVPGPIERALAAAKLSLDQIDHIIIVGAATRMPKVQEILTQHTKRELGKNLNADEAPALGAVYRAADLSTGFQVKKFLTKDAVVLPIEVDFERELDPTEDGQKVVKVVRRTLFPVMNPYPQKKVLTFNKHHEDFTFFVNYGNMSTLPEAEVALVGSTNLTKVNLIGIGDALAKHKEDGAEFKGIKAHFAIDDSGLLALSAVETTFEKVHPVEPENSSTNTTEGEAANATDATNSTDKTNSAKQEKKPKTEVMKEEVAKEETLLDLLDLTGDALVTAKKRIEELNEKERIRREKEIARNSLETYILDIQDKLSQEEYESLTTEEERTTILEKSSQISDWLYDEGSDEEAKAYREKHQELKDLTGGMHDRHRELKGRPEVIGAFKNALNVSTHFMNKIKNATPDEKFLEDSDLETLQTLLEENQAWLEKKMTEQEKTPLHEAPVLTLKSIADKMAVLDRKVKTFVNKAKDARAKKLREMAEKLKEYEKKANETSESDAKKEEGKSKSEAEKEQADENDKPEKESKNAEDQKESLDDEHVEL